jgi:GMP synthase (glutamine-hydrolysing)
VNILCLTHADFETPGTIESWASDNGHDFTISKPYAGELLPDAGGFDWVIVMGGPQSGIRLNDYPYLVQEVELLRAAVTQKKKVLGLCLGAQLIGAALGAKTLRSPQKEVGVYPITLTHFAHSDPLLAGLPRSFPVIHWHNDMPGLTDRAVVLASSPGCPRQIVRYGSITYGFQCHLEITREGIQTMVAAVPEDLQPSKYTQSQTQILEQDYPVINGLMRTILDRFARLAV